MVYFEAEKVKMSNAFHFNYVTGHGFISFLVLRIFLEGLRRGARDPECYKRIRFPFVMLPLKS